MASSESLSLEPNMAQELEGFRRDHIDFASSDPYDHDALHDALEATASWLDTVGGDICPETPTRTVGSERGVFRAYSDQLASDAPAYFGLIKAIASSLPKMDSSCRLAVNMPASDERATIGNALGHMLVRRNDSGGLELAQRGNTGATVSPRTYELLVCTNRSNEREDDGTMEAVQEFIGEHQLPVNIMAIDVTLPPHVANSGMARRILHDTTIVRSLQRTEQDGTLYIAAEDADADGYDPYAFDTYVRYLDNNPDKSAARMRTERNPFDMVAIPPLLIKHRYMTQLITFLRSAVFQPPNNPNYSFRFNRKVPSGYGTAFVAADLINARGFPIGGPSEDLLLGEQLAVMRGSNVSGRIEPATHTVGAVPTVVLSSPRREIAAYINNIDPYEGDNFSKQSVHELTRQPISQLIKQAQKMGRAESREWLLDQMEQSMQRIAATAPTPEIARRTANLLLVMTGFGRGDYKITQGGPRLHLEVNSWAQLEQRAEKYQPSPRILNAIASTTLA